MPPETPPPSQPVASGSLTQRVPHPPVGAASSGARTARSPVRRVSAAASGTAARGSLSARPSDSRVVGLQQPLVTEPLTIRAGTEVLREVASKAPLETRVTQSARAASGSLSPLNSQGPSVGAADQMAELRSQSAFVRASVTCAHAPEAIARRMDEVARRYYKTSYLDQFPPYPPEQEDDYDRYVMYFCAPYN